MATPGPSIPFGEPAYRASRRRFYGLAALICLPVLILAVVGILFLKQERQLAEQEARNRAQEIGVELANRVDAILDPVALRSNDLLLAESGVGSGSKGWLQLTLNTNRTLLAPPALQQLHPHRLNVELLTPAQSNLWQQFQHATYREPPSASVALATLADLHQSELPPDFSVNAVWNQALLVAQSGDLNQARDILENALQRFPDAVLETGLPLSILAPWKELQWLEHSPDSSIASAAPELLVALCSNAVNTPSPLTSFFLDQAEKWETTHQATTNLTDQWRILWNQHQLARQLYHSISIDAPHSTRTNALFWVGNEPSWLVIPRQLPNTGSEMTCISLERIYVDLPRPLGLLSNAPNYLGFQISVADRIIIPRFPLVRAESGLRFYRGRLSLEEAEIKQWIQWLTDESRTLALTGPRLASASSSRSPGVQVDLFLDTPEILWEQYRQRSLWFFILIFGSLNASLAGVYALWRSFNQQLRLNALKSNFVSSVSHELRAPIASVRLMAESLERGKITDAAKQSNYFRLMVQQCRRLGSLIDNVLDFSRIDQGQRQYEREPTDVQALCAQTVQLMEPNAVERRVRLSFEPSDPAAVKVTALADGKALQQALINLLDNALKHAPAESTVTVQLAHSSHSTSSIQLSVEDQGPGIPPEDQTRIFEPFYRRGTELRRETEGVGIGLSIVKHIMQAHHGTVRVESEPGRGCCFTLELPGLNSDSEISPDKPSAP